MKLYEGQVFHFYNQGNNRKPIFYDHENYEFFIWKMKTYLLPFGDFISYCLMPNHFHWQFFVKKIAVDMTTIKKHANKIEFERRKKKYGKNARQAKLYTDDRDLEKFRDLNFSIGLVQRTYAQSFNGKYARSGSLFRQKCKAKTKFDLKNFSGWSSIDSRDLNLFQKKDYISVCFQYIHDNPVKAGLADRPNQWKYSSAREYEGKSNFKLCNIDLGKELVSTEPESR